MDIKPYKIAKHDTYILTNNIMQKYTLFILVIAATISASAAKQLDRSPVYPSVWHRPDTAIIYPNLCDSIPLSDAYTMMMVYCPLRSDSIQPLWTLVIDSVSYSVAAAKHVSKPVIYTMHHSLSTDTSLSTIGRLYTGTFELKNSHLSLYESAYFPFSLTRPQSLMFQTYLALRYGITLRKADYLSPQGNIIWSARDYADYYHRVHGIASDPFYHYFSIHSVSMEDSLVSLSVSDTLPDFSYALIGDNGAEVDWTPYEGNTAVLQRRWFMHTSGRMPSEAALDIHTSLFPDYSDTLFLALLSEENVIQSLVPPSSVDSLGIARYTLPCTDSYFSFASRFEHRPSRAHTHHVYTEQNPESLSLDQTFRLTPNPTHGPFTLDIHLAQETPITITIHDAMGKLIGRQILGPMTSYHYQGCLHNPGVYLITVTDDCHQTLFTHHLLIY